MNANPATLAGWHTKYFRRLVKLPIEGTNQECKTRMIIDLIHRKARRVRSAVWEWANLRREMPFWDRISTICGFVCLWFSVAAYLNAGDYSLLALLILILGVGSLINYYVRFRLLVGRCVHWIWGKERDIVAVIICVLVMLVAIAGCYWTAWVIYAPPK